ncbi:MAG: integron [Pseudomonadota bacterium]
MRNRLTFATCAALLIATFAGPLAARIEAGERLVMVGRDGAELDACSSLGQVHGLKKDGDDFLSVRIAPGSASKERDRIANGTRLFLCDEHNDWYGVVYQQTGDALVDCGASTPSSYVGAYRGPCRYGWVHKYFVEFLAG